MRFLYTCGKLITVKEKTARVYRSEAEFTFGAFEREFILRFPVEGSFLTEFGTLLFCAAGRIWQLSFDSDADSVKPSFVDMCAAPRGVLGVTVAMLRGEIFCFCGQQVRSQLSTSDVFKFNGRALIKLPAAGFPHFAFASAFRADDGIYIFGGVQSSIERDAMLNQLLFFDGTRTRDCSFPGLPELCAADVHAIGEWTLLSGGVVCNQPNTMGYLVSITQQRVIRFRLGADDPVACGSRFIAPEYLVDMCVFYRDEESQRRISGR